jgi:predicted RNA-binding Zn-ribbon protein involved in translation (DUF1610 family)
VGRLRDFLDIFKQVKYQKPQPKFCPNCRSHNISSKETYGALPQTYSCRDCDYEGHVVLEMDLEGRNEGLQNL